MSKEQQPTIEDLRREEYDLEGQQDLVREDREAEWHWHKPTGTCIDDHRCETCEHDFSDRCLICAAGFAMGRRCYWENAR